ncbi:protein kinase domain-containing protein [Kouleothrix sp.]|uniref:protein kinase domain-containing protein n=1 Tax=Kouleothrix sp. TaxID=2779161 RepID=UPI00391A6DA3
MKYDVYISYSKKDRTWVKDWLLQRLENAGLTVCVDYRDFVFGHPKMRNIENAVDNSHKILLILTEDWLLSEFTEFTELIARNGDPNNTIRNRIIPVKLEVFTLPKRLEILDCIDLTNYSMREQKLQQIIQKITNSSSNIRKNKNIEFEVPIPDFPTESEVHEGTEKETDASMSSVSPIPPLLLPFADPFIENATVGEGQRYRIIRPLGKGGFATAYLAEDLPLKRKYVIKRLTLTPEMSDDERRNVRHTFKEEVRILKELSDEHTEGIPKIWDLLEKHDSFVMDYIEGANLNELLEQANGRALPLINALSYIQKVCDILVRLHTHRPIIIHRDITPSNIMRGRDGRIWLIDFGLGKLLSREYSTGGVYDYGGTRGFMAPEQLEGQTEPRSDIYTLAVTLYVLLTGKQHYLSAGRPLPLASKVNPNIPPEVDQLITESWSTRIEDRPNAQVFLNRLNIIIQSLRGSAPVHAPDGKVIETSRELVMWCINNWETGVQWARSDLHNQLRNNWGKTELSDKVRDLVSDSLIPQNILLDTILLLIDQDFYGNGPYLISADNPALNFGNIEKDNPKELTINITNTSRRYLRARIDYPEWIIINHPTIELYPYRPITISLALNEHRLPNKPALNEFIFVKKEGDELLRIRVQAIRIPVNSKHNSYKIIMLYLAVLTFFTALIFYFVKYY